MDVKIGNILVVTDFSEQADICVEQAINLANILKLDINLLYIVPKLPFYSNLFGEKINGYLDNEAKQKLIEISKNIFEKYQIKLNTYIETGDPGKKTIEVSNKLGSRYIIIPAKSYIDPNSKEVSPCTKKAFRKSKCPVMTINGSEHFCRIHSILLPLDLTKETKSKINEAVKLAETYNSTLKVISFLYKNSEQVIIKLETQLIQVKRYLDNKKVKCEIDLLDYTNVEKVDPVYHISKYAAENQTDLIMVVTQQEPDDLFTLNTDLVVRKLVVDTKTPVMCIPAVPPPVGSVVGY